MFSDLFWNLEDFPRSWEQPRWRDCTRSAAAVTTFNSCVKTTCYCFPPPPPPCPRSRPSTAEANIIPKHFQTPLPSYEREIPGKSKIVEQQQTNPLEQNISCKCFHCSSALEVLVATESVWSCFLTPSWQKMGVISNKKVNILMQMGTSLFCKQNFYNLSMRGFSEDLMLNSGDWPAYTMKSYLVQQEPISQYYAITISLFL